MKLRIFDYDISEYQLLEDHLNELSKQGYNSSSFDIITNLKKDNQQYHYYVQPFIKAKKYTSKRIQLNSIIDHYTEQDFTYCGKIRNLIIFRNEENKNPPITSKDEIVSNLTIKSLNKFVLLIMAVLICLYLTITILSNNQLSKFTTTGGIILHYFIIPFSLLIIYRLLYKLLINRKIIKTMKNNQKISKSENNTISKLKLVFKGLFVVTIVLLIIGISLDYLNREEINLDNTVLTLDNLGVTGSSKDYPSYTKMHSFLIDKTITYAQVIDDNALYEKYYQINDAHRLNTYFNDHLDDYIDANTKYKKLDDSTYLLALNQEYDSIIFKTANKIVYVNTSLEIYNSNLYKTIKDFYK